MIQTLITFIIVFGIIVAVHEYGHLYFAKRAGILVREFSIGMGPKIFSHQAKDGTSYTIRILPLGGYVRMAGWGDDATDIKKGTPASLKIENDKVVKINLSDQVELENAVPMQVTNYDFEEALFIEGEVFGEIKRFEVDHDATIIEEDGLLIRIAPRDVQYQSATVWGKMLTNFAGPLFNFILGVIAFIILTFMQGGVPSDSSTVGQVPKDQPAYQAGIREADKIISIDGKKTATWKDVVSNITASKGEKLTFLVDRAGSEKTIAVTPKKENGTYKIGIAVSIKTGIIDKITGGFQQAWNSATMIFRALGKLITHPSVDQLGGPVAIFQLSGQAASGGLITVIGFIAMLSINLGIMNLLPIPVLDGGKILLNIIEAIRGKALSQEKEGYVTIVGAVLMIILFIAVTFNDILRFIGQ